MRRLQEKDVEQNMLQCLATHDKKKSKPAKFDPSARFPRKRDRLRPGSGSKNVFGPCQQHSGSIQTLLVLKRYEAHPSTPTHVDNPWLYYLDRNPPTTSTTRSHPPLTPAVGVMITEPKFNDSEAAALFASYTSCDVQLLPAESWDSVTFTLPHAIKAAEPISLQSITGATVLFLACYVIGDDDSMNKLLHMRKTGSAIIKDLLDNDIASLLEDRVHSCTKLLFEDAMRKRSDWTLDSMCRHLSLWFKVWTRRRKTARFHVHHPLQIEELVEDLFALWREKPLTGRRVFAQDTEEGWEDTAEVAMLGAYYGSAVATIVLVALTRVDDGKAKIAKREGLAKLGNEWSSNCQSILSSVLKSGVTIKTDATSEAFLEHINRRIVAQNREELVNITFALFRTRDKLTTVVQSYSSIMDGKRLRAAFQQAFASVVTQDVPIDAAAVHTFFGTEEADEHIAALRLGKLEHYNAGFSKVIFEDLESPRITAYTEKDLLTDARFKGCIVRASPPSTNLDPLPAMRAIAEKEQVQRMRSAERAAERTALITAGSAKLALPGTSPAEEVRAGTGTPSANGFNVHPPKSLLAVLGLRDTSSRTSWLKGHSYTVLILSSILATLIAIVSHRTTLWPGFSQPKNHTTSLTSASSHAGVRASPQALMARVTGEWEFADDLHVSDGDMVELLGKSVDGWYMVKVSNVDKVGVGCPACRR